ncbi:hypothetical protein TPHV1_200044 [Treponema phagedenis]|uniref:Uncharacterized protein n=1 Tax=Treponema phagedenis TaxID=162 RepID=A0A0B7GSY4_TREPH|nr:hypothetical protein TPHV1_200044 [Treponema phagedenis]
MSKTRTTSLKCMQRLRALPKAAREPSFIVWVPENPLNFNAPDSIAAKVKGSDYPQNKIKSYTP